MVTLLKTRELRPEIKAANTVAMQFKSQLDGEEIVALFTGLQKNSQNKKLGSMVTVYILVDNGLSPQSNASSGADKSICGDCALRNNVCYVVKIHGPSAVYRGYLNGNSPVVSESELIALLADRNYPIRWGEYGDIAALPFSFIDNVMESTKLEHTSYTHQWDHKNFNVEHLKYSMSSVDHVKTLPLLQALHGDKVRYYRMDSNGENLLPGEIRCPNKDKDGNTQVQCRDCLLCQGTSKQAKNIVELII